MAEVPAWLSTTFDRRAVARQAERLVQALHARRPNLLETLRRDPLEALRNFTEVQFELNEHSNSGGCSVLGRYDPSTEPPTISVTRTSQGQTWFSALHELGHHEQQGDFGWLSAMSDLPPREQRSLEEQVCEAFAAEVLLGSDVVHATIGDGISTARSIETLRHATGASRAACAVRVIQLLRADGAVMVTDLKGEVLFATGSGDVIAPRRGTVQPPDSVVARAASAGTSSSRDAAIMYGTGRQRHGFAADAVRDGQYVYAVFTSGRPGWATGAYIPRALHWDRAEHYCPCGEVFTPGTGNHCHHCARADRCPECNRCICEPAPARERTCTSCFLSLSLARFDGDSPTCRDC
ncbi:MULTISPECIES: ImmA/IrrE family metallo-endopeptidase [unclassified Aeromicrobium]|uniref:ImmA/IrrE family metallo-endopeptidase n=1 Tax=unclassified Aeromicrobium TaxID=2633570 RepID=UPI002889411E|nr:MULTISPECIES: ImmA/IrrE family metallo-endopeptidase [unclassified Aeromicrobium]